MLEFKVVISEKHFKQLKEHMETYSGFSFTNDEDAIVECFYSNEGDGIDFRDEVIVTKV